MNNIELINYIRITQILVENGWKLIDNGYPRITMALNEKEEIFIAFENNEQFLQWMKENQNLIL